MHRFASCAPAALVGALALLLLAPAGAAAQTTIPGGNIVNQTWTAADSPYVVQGDITVPAGAFLVLQAGTVVRFATSDAAASGADTSRPELIVLGTLTASGTAASPVTLESSGSSTTSWYGVRAMSGSMVSLTYTTLVEAANGLAVEGGNPSMTDSVLRGNRYGLYVASGSPTLTRTVLTQNATAVRAVGPGTTSIVGCTLAYNTGTAIESLGGSTTVIDSIITNNSGYGVYTAGGASTVTYSDVWSNSSANYFGTSAGTGTLSTNPLYVSPSNLRLTSNSPCRFGAMGGGDMGALAYTSDATPGLYGTLWTSATAMVGTTPVPGDLTIAPGVTLTLPAGATLSFATSDVMAANADVSRAELIVQGTLAVTGTPGSPATLSSSGSSSTSWYGVRLLPTATVAIASLVLEEAANGLAIEGASATSGIDGITLRANRYGLYVASGSVTIAHGVFSQNATAVRAVGAGTTTLVGCTLAYNTGTAIESLGGSAIVRDSIITHNSGYGVYTAGGSTSVTYSDVWSNSSANYFGTSAGSGTLSINPLYVSGSDFRLTSNSPCRFGAMAGGDMGALPYTSDPTPGLYGTLWSDTTLTPGTYPVAGDLAIAMGVTLTIPAGTTLQFATSDLMAANADVSRAELIVRGTLVVSGTGASPVVLTSSGSSTTSWYGMRLLTGATPDITSLVLEEAANGLAIEGAMASDGIDALTLRGNRYGLYVASGSVTVTNTVWMQNSTAVRAVGPGATTLVNGTLAYNTGTAIESLGGSMVVVNTIIASNSGYGVYTAGGSSTVTYSDVWGNSSANYFGTSAGTGTISVNPFFVSASDLHLTSTSPCIDSGTAMGAPSNDRDLVLRPLDGDGIGGAAHDMGAFEHARMTVCGDGMLGAGEACDEGALSGMYGHCRADCSGPGPRCGDGMTNGPEACDDGNGVETDACTSSCAAARCGDGFVQAGVEGCDDANAVDTDACTNACRAATCGDGIRYAGVEACDDGNASSTDACVACVVAFCGDGYVRSGVELCDDGNGSDTDACTNSCSPARCGDGIVGPGESCDDGNTIDGDGCSNMCRPAMCGDGIVQMGEACDDGDRINDDECSNACRLPMCGDGIVHMGEMCDDANLVDGDGCDGDCTTTRCGNGRVTAGEDCDDGNADPTDACASCRTARCGDGFVRAGAEACDDGNTDDDDGCVDACVLATCGDGHHYIGVEACDDGNTMDGDGCSSTCALASCGNGVTDPGEECDDGNASSLDACTNSCFAARCGDGFVRTGSEACDDGNDLDTDACVEGCRRASCGDGFVHAGTEACDDANGETTDACLPTCEAASCGDGFVHEGAEQCDDGGSTPGDGCSASCTTEAEVGDGGTSADAGATGSDGGSDGGFDGGVEPMMPGSAGGCGCSVPARGPSAPSALVIAGLALVLALRSRRRR